MSTEDDAKKPSEDERVDDAGDAEAVDASSDRDAESGDAESETSDEDASEPSEDDEGTSPKKKSSEEGRPKAKSTGGAKKPEPKHSSGSTDTVAPADEPHHSKRGPLDMVMRAFVMIALGVFITTPLWCQKGPEAHDGPTDFRVDRSDENSTEARLARIIKRTIRAAAADQEVDEVATARELADILQEAEIGERAERADQTTQLVADVLAQAAETSNLGFSQLQDQAIDGQARVMARTLITSLGGTLDDVAADAPEGNWEPAPWPILSGFEYEEGMDLPPQVRSLDGQDVMAWGYLLYLEDDQFLLVQSLWSCCFGTPPDLHEAIVVRAPIDNRQHEGRGVRIYGRFEASELREDGYVTSLYRLDSEAVLPM